jgi:hypothetical protein
MVRLVATLALLIPLSLNGLRVVCAEPDSPEAAAAAAAATATAHCDRICPAHKTARVEATRSDAGSGGSVCVLTAGEKGCPVAGLLFAVSVPVVLVDRFERSVSYDTVADASPLYLSPSLGHLCPPPKA